MLTSEPADVEIGEFRFQVPDDDHRHWSPDTKNLTCRLVVSANCPVDNRCRLSCGSGSFESRRTQGFRSCQSHAREDGASCKFAASLLCVESSQPIGELGGPHRKSPEMVYRWATVRSAEHSGIGR